MSKNRRLRASLAVVAAVGVALTMAAPADAAPPKRISPPQISVQPTSPSRSTTATFSWTEATTGVSFTCSFDGGTVPCGNPGGRTFAGLSERTHTFTVRGTRTGWKSASSSASYTVDLTPPVAPTITDVPLLTNKPIAPTISDTSTDVDHFICLVDGLTTLNPCLSGGSITLVLADGRHTLTAQAVDRAGNVGPASIPTAWVIKTTVQAPFVTSGPNLVTNLPATTFTFDTGESGATFQCELDSKAFAGCTSPSSFNVTNPNLNGPHSFVVRALDSLGNFADSLAYTWTINTSASTTPIISWDPGSLPAALTSNPSGTIKFSTNPVATTLQCVLDGTQLGTCAAGGTGLGTLGDGKHTFTVTANKGLATENSATYAWVVDTTPPPAPSIYGPAALTNAASATVSVVPGALNDATTCTVAAPGTAPAGVACSLTQLISETTTSEGLYTVTATERDKALNASTASYSWKVDHTPPTVTVSAPTAVDGFAKVTLNEDGTSAGASPALALSTGAAVATRRVCLNVGGAVVDCGSTSVRTIRLFGASTLIPGQNYVVQVNPAGLTPLTDVAGNVAATSSTAFRAAVTQQENSPATVQAWRTVKTTAAKGGSYVLETRAGALAFWRFTGTHFTAYLASGPTFGLAKVYVDGVLKGTWNQYAATQRFTSARPVRGLANTSHTVKVLVTGVRGSRAAKGAAVGIDAFASATLQRTPALTMRWARVYAKTASGSYRALAGLPGETFAMTFAGVGIRWVHPVGPAYGIAVVFVDGVKKATVDSYAASAKERVIWTSATLAAGRHTIRIVTLGTKRAASKGTTVGVDFLQAR